MKRSFYLVMMIFISVLILFGFSHTVEALVIKPAAPPPKVLYIHVAVLLGWLVMVLTQTTLIWTRNPRIHMKLGWFGAGFGVLMVFVGFAVTLIMGHEHVLREGPIGGIFIYRPFADITLFGVFFGLAIYWRKRPDYHRRLMLLAAIIVTPPAMSRIPGVHGLRMVYGCTDLLIVVAVLNDLFTLKRINAVYRWACPIIVLAQLAIFAAVTLRPAALVKLGLAMTR